MTIGNAIIAARENAYISHLRKQRKQVNRFVAQQLM